MVNMRYQELKPSARGWLWSEQLGLWFGLWEGRYLKSNDTWLRFYDENGNLVPTEGEFEAHRAEQERQRAEQEATARRQADSRSEQEAEARRQAEAELAQVRAELEVLRRQSENNR